MEMPIQVIVVLFVALVVGGAIIAFSQNTLNTAQLDLNQWRNDPQKRDMLIEVQNATAETVLGLAGACLEQHTGGVTEADCFALFADTFAVDWDALNGTNISQQFTLDTTGVDDPSAVRIAYHPAGRITVR